MCPVEPDKKQQGKYSQPIHRRGCICHVFCQSVLVKYCSMHMEMSSKNLIRWYTPTPDSYVIYCHFCSKTTANPYNHSAFALLHERLSLKTANNYILQHSVHSEHTFALQHIDTLKRSLNIVDSPVF